MTYKRKDYFYRKAKAEKKASRAAYKIDQIQKKYKLIKKGDVIIDLGAAPGGWMQELSQMVGKKGFVLGVDVLPLHIQPASNTFFLQVDAGAENILEKLRQKLPAPEANNIVSDMSPDLSGISFRDSYNSYLLAKRALDISHELLGEGGNLVVKIFPGDEFKGFIQELKKCFEEVHTIVPPATRSTSSEIYLVAKGYRHT